MAPEAYLYGLPWKYFEELGVRRYGFHGTSHRYVSQQAHDLLDLQSDDSGLVVAHPGNGASICAVRNGQSVDTSMGMTPLEGLMMGTRSGDVDFGAMAWIASETNQTLRDLERVVNKESGLLGISGLSSDLRTLEKARTRDMSVRSWRLKRLCIVSRVISPGMPHRCIVLMGLFSLVE